MKTLMAAAILLAAMSAFGQNFTYQGRLVENGVPVNGTRNLDFTLFRQASGGFFEMKYFRHNTPIINGVFTVTLGPWPTQSRGADRWLEITVNDTPLSPRVPITSTPYANYAFYSGAPWETQPDNSISYLNGDITIGMGRAINRFNSFQSNFNGTDYNQNSVRWVSEPPFGGNMLWLAGESGIRFLHANGSHGILSPIGRWGLGTELPMHRLDVNGRIHVSQGVIQKGGLAVNSTADLGLYSQNSGEWLRLVTNSAPIEIFFDGGAGSTRAISMTQTDGHARTQWRTAGGTPMLVAGSIAGSFTPVFGIYLPGTNIIASGIRLNANNTTEVFGTLKTFRESNPRDPNTDIVYGSLEGPEAGAYLRGTARLVEGEATIEFPEHFQDVAIAEGMTVQLTPRSADSKGLAVVSQSLLGFTVKELFAGKGNYEFHWQAVAVRKRFENFEVIQPKIVDGPAEAIETK